MPAHSASGSERSTSPRPTSCSRRLSVARSRPACASGSGSSAAAMRCTSPSFCAACSPAVRLASKTGCGGCPGARRCRRSLAELVSARIERLGDGVRRSLELLALGEPLRLSELTRLEPLDSLVTAEAEKLITVDEAMTDPVLRLAHPLYGEAIRASLPGLRARQVRLRLAESLQQNPSLTPEVSLRVARWLTEAGEPVPHRLLGDAAGDAIATGDPELGGLLAERALEAGGGMEAQLLLARSLAARNRFEEAAAALADAERDDQSAGHGDRTGRSDRLSPAADRGAVLGTESRRGPARAARACEHVVAGHLVAAPPRSAARPDRRAPPARALRPPADCKPRPCPMPPAPIPTVSARSRRRSCGGSPTTVVAAMRTGWRSRCVRGCRSGTCTTKAQRP